MSNKWFNKIIRSIPPKREHYLNIAFRKEPPQLIASISYEEVLGMSIKERLIMVKKNTDRYIDLFKDKEVSGFYAALTAMLSNVYVECRGNSEIFAFRTYPFLCEYVFAPSERIYEQEIKNPLLGGNLGFFSMLTLIDHGIKASGLYNEGISLGRTKYLKFYFTSGLIELFRGLEYLSRLYYIKTNNLEAGPRFKDFLKSVSKLNDVEINALWECRCGIIHSGCLYNLNKNNIWRFGINNFLKNNKVITQDNRLPSLEGKHFTIYTKALTELFYEAKNIVYRDMKENPEKYLTNADFFVWIRRYLSVQYLPSEGEYSKMFAGLKPNVLNVDEMYFSNLPRIGMAKIKVSILYIKMLGLPRIKEDLFSRIRDTFSTL
jgi:hypothetical protein